MRIMASMSPNITLEFASETDTGKVRTHNEDAIVISPAQGFAVLADGMGGYQAGEVASQIAVRVMEAALSQASMGLQQATSEWGPVQELMVAAVQQANAAIIQAARDTPRYAGMGTTLVAVLFHQHAVTIAHAGDSRAYRLRGKSIVQMTRDHSLLQEQIDAGILPPERAADFQYKNIITRALGVYPTVQAEVQSHPVEPGDIYLLCSDGLTDMLVDEEVVETIEAACGGLQAMCRALVEEANVRGGVDNISAVLIRVNEETSGPNLLSRLARWIA